MTEAELGRERIPREVVEQLNVHARPATEQVDVGNHRLFLFE